MSEEDKTYTQSPLRRIVKEKKIRKVKPKSKFMHFYASHIVTWKGKPVEREVSFAGLVDGNNLKIGHSECSSEDNPNRRIGRGKAEGRVKKKPLAIIDMSAKNNVGKKVTELFIKYCVKALKKDGVLSQMHYEHVKLMAKHKASV